MIERRSRDEVVAATQHWLTRAVIGLNLCPFAKSVHVKNQIRYVVSEARTLEDVRGRFVEGTADARGSGPGAHRYDAADRARCARRFHRLQRRALLRRSLVEPDGIRRRTSDRELSPAYRFEGTEPDDIENYTNRAPYPIFHLLREASIERAVDAFPDAADIYERNMETLRRLGHEGWKDLLGKP